MKAVVPIAGRGNKKATKIDPMLCVAGKPLIGHIVDKIIEFGVREIILIVGEEYEEIIKYLSSKYKKQEFIYIKQRKRKGNAHAVLGAARHIKDEPFLIVFGDSLVNIDIKSAKREKADVVLWVKEVKDPRKYGVTLVEKNKLPGRVTKIIEKPKEPISNFAIVGAYYIKSPKKLFKAIKDIIEANIIINGQYYLSTALDLLINQGNVVVAKQVKRWLDLSTTKDLLEANQLLLMESRSKNKGKVENSVINKPVFIGKNTRIVNSVVGPNVSIGDDTYIENSIIVNSVIGNGVKIVNAGIVDSIVEDGASIIEKLRKYKITRNSYVSE